MVVKLRLNQGYLIMVYVQPYERDVKPFLLYSQFRPTLCAVVKAYECNVYVCEKQGTAGLTDLEHSSCSEK